MMEKQEPELNCPASYTLSQPFARTTNKYCVSVPARLNTMPSWRTSSPETRASQTTKPVNAFLIFSNMHRHQLKQSMPHLNNKELAIKLGELWQEMTEEHKMFYFAEAKRCQLERSSRYPDRDAEAHHRYISTQTQQTSPVGRKFGGTVPQQTSPVGRKFSDTVPQQMSPARRTFGGNISSPTGHKADGSVPQQTSPAGRKLGKLSSPAGYKFGGYVPPFSKFQPQRRKRKKGKQCTSDISSPLPASTSPVYHNALPRNSPLYHNELHKNALDSDGYHHTDLSSQGECETAVASILDTNDAEALHTTDTDCVEVPQPCRETSHRLVQTQPISVAKTVTDNPSCLSHWGQMILRGQSPSQTDTIAIPSLLLPSEDRTTPMDLNTELSSNPTMERNSEHGDWAKGSNKHIDESGESEEEKSNYVMIPCDVTIADMLGWPVHLLPRIPVSILKRFKEKVKQSPHMMNIRRMMQFGDLPNAGGDSSPLPHHLSASGANSQSPGQSPFYREQMAENNDSPYLRHLTGNQESPASSTYLDSNIEHPPDDPAQEIIVSEQIEISSWTDKPTVVKDISL